MPFRVTPAEEYTQQQETLTGSIPVHLSKPYLLFHSVLKSREVSMMLFVEPVNLVVLVCRGLT